MRMLGPTSAKRGTPLLHGTGTCRSSRSLRVYSRVAVDLGYADRKNVQLYRNLHSGASTPPGGAGAWRTKPEVLAPAGGWPQLHAAVENGADAIYLGLSSFNARARAENFTQRELKDACDYCHARGVRVFVTLNVLVFEEELADVEALVRGVAEGGADAIIVQDVGVAEVARRVAPNLRIHGSTQMSVTSGEGAQFAEQLGCQRVVLARELSVAEIAKTVRTADVEVEVFVHGALCVSYSGQCFSSKAWGGRSANRGQCAQACRMPYGLVVDGELRELGDVKYLLSPQDLMAVEHLSQLIEAGVSCLKIEGRLKGPEYVALTTKVYREAVDAAWRQIAQDSSAPPDAAAAPTLDQRTRAQLQQVFARGQDESFSGLTPGFLEGPQHQRLVRGNNPRHRGVCVGRVVEVRGSRVLLDVLAPIAVGEGVVFDGGAPDGAEEGGNIVQVRTMVSGRRSSAVQRVESGRCSIEVRDADASRIEPGHLCWRTKQVALERELRHSYERVSAVDRRRVSVAATISGRVGSPAVLRLQDEDGHSVVTESSSSLQQAQAKPLSEAQLRKALGSTLGQDTPFALEECNVQGLTLGDGVFLPMNDLKEMRRQAVQQLLIERTRNCSAVDLATASVVDELTRAPAASSSGPHCAQPASEPQDECNMLIVVGWHARHAFEPICDMQVRVLCRTRAQVSAALELDWLDEVSLDFLEVHGLRDAVRDVHAAGKRVIVATPRVLKPDEQRLWRFYLGLHADALLLRSAGLLQQLLSLGGPGATVPGTELVVPELMGDFSLNVANSISARTFLASSISRLTPTHDLSVLQLQGLADALDPSERSRLEVIAHHHLPIFHTEHCVFCRFLSDGNSYKDCGHPCESAQVHLRDDGGQDHLVLADMGCRNTVFNAQSQSAALRIPQLLKAGYRSFRVELVDEDAASVGQLLNGYCELLAGELPTSQLWQRLQRVPDANGRVHGCSEGSLAAKAEVAWSGMKQTAAAQRQSRSRQT